MCQFLESGNVAAFGVSAIIVSGSRRKEEIELVHGIFHAEIIVSKRCVGITGTL
jgi:hypothetical protein